jgi:hypothetical protein
MNFGLCDGPHGLHSRVIRRCQPVEKFCKTQQIAASQIKGRAQATPQLNNTVDLQVKCVHVPHHVSKF